MKRVQIFQTFTFLGLLAAVIACVLLALQGRQAHDALCKFKVDLAQRANGGRDFLKAHPEGIPGIPASLIRSSVKNQQATLDSLSSLTCPSTKGAK